MVLTYREKICEPELLLGMRTHTYVSNLLFRTVERQHKAHNGTITCQLWVYLTSFYSHYLLFSWELFFFCEITISTTPPPLPI